MSKTSSAVVCETNQIQGQNQENVFFHSLYRLPEDFQSPFIRSAKATSPIQVCALFSAQGDDTAAAMTLQEVLKQLRGLVAQAQLKNVLDYDSFSEQVVTVLNNTVCQASLRQNGAKIRVSMSMVILEGDTLRVLNIGNTHVWLFRQGKMISLTENQTVAHRAVQMGAIPKEAEMTHEGKNELTQFLGRLPQDGEVIPDKKVHLKLLDGDELFMIGTGLDQNISPAKLGSVIARPSVPETKVADLISLGLDEGVEAGLTAMEIRIERTLLLPGDADFDSNSMANNLSKANVKQDSAENAAAVASRAATDATVVASVLHTEETEKVSEDTVVAPFANASATKTSNNDTSYEEEYDDEDEDYEEDYEDEDDNEEDYDDYDEEDALTVAERRERRAGGKKKVLKSILTGFIIFVICVLLGFGGMYILFNAGHWTGKLKKNNPATETVQSEPVTSTESSQEAEGKVVYALFDNTSLYVEAALDSQSIDTLARGEAVTLLATNEQFAKVRKENGLMGYVPLEMVSSEDPTIAESDAEDFIDPTPVPKTN